MAPQEIEVADDEWNDEAIHYENTKPPPPMRIMWGHVSFFVFLHLYAFIGVYLSFTSALFATIAFAWILHVLCAIGVICGTHRLWAHRSYKAVFAWRVILMVLQTCAFQKDIIDWCLEHRVHHKYSETDADPHDARRGFFFSHIGWLMVRAHPDFLEKGKGIDFTDLWADPVVRFQRKHYIKLLFLFWFVIPTVIPMYFWGESLINSAFICVMLRYTITLNATWLVNSAAHLWGSQPYDKSINPRESPWVIFTGAGEGYHNYHHTFPMDYKASEVPYVYSYATAVIDLAAAFGLVYDRKQVPPEVIEKRKKRTGDLFHHH